MFKVGDVVHSFITGHYGYVAGFRPNGDVIVSWPAYVTDESPESLEGPTTDKATNSAF